MFFDNYCKLCKDKGLSPTGAGVEMGLSRGTVSAWRNKERLPQASQLQKIAEYFDVTVDYLLVNTKTGEREQAPEIAQQTVELEEYLNELKNREDMRILFSLAKNATKEEVMQAVKIIEALKND